LLFASNFNSILKYEADVEHSTLWCLISSSLGCIESTYEWNRLLWIDKMSSFYRNVELKATESDIFSSYRISWINSASYFKNRSANKDWLIDWLVIICFTSRSRIFQLCGDVTIAGEGLQNLGLFRPILGFSGLIRRTAP
jgi:hypothetical protein